MKIKGCTALVTGANRGIGASFAEELLAAGANKVYLGCRDTAQAQALLDQLGERAVAISLDVTDEAAVVAAAATCTDVDLIINNAGYHADQTLMGAESLGAARQEMEVNYFGVLSMCRHFAPVLASNGGGAIVNVLSAAAIVSVPRMGGYSPSKFAARALTTSMRAELAHQGTQCHALIVGSVDTRMASHVAGQKEPPSVVAKAGLRAVEKNIPEVDTDAFAINVRAAKSRDPARLEQQMAAMLNLESLHTGR